MRRTGRSFKRFAKAIARAGTEPKYDIIAQQLGDSLAQGDGTSRTLGIMNLTSNLIQGDENDQFQGNSVWLKGVGIKFNISPNADPGFGGLSVRWTLFFSRTNATNMLGSGAVYASTTTSSANPTQASPFANPRIFETVATPSMFVGDSYATHFDRTNIKVIKTKMFKINNGGSGINANCKKFFFPIHRIFHYQNPDNTTLTSAPNHGRFGSYYLIYEVFQEAGTANISNAVLGTMDWEVRLYFRDP